MAKLKSFEQFVAEMDKSEEIENNEVEVATPDTKEVEETEEEAEEVQASEESEVEEVEEAEEAGLPAEELKDETVEIDSDVEEPENVEKDLELEGEGDAEGEEITEEAEVSEEAEEEAEEVNAEESNPTVAEMLKNCYEMVKNEAKVWEEDAHDDHTVESYMKENAALVAALAANTLKK